MSEDGRNPFSESRTDGGKDDSASSEETHVMELGGLDASEPLVPPAPKDAADEPTVIPAEPFSAPGAREDEPSAIRRGPSHPAPSAGQAPIITDPPVAGHRSVDQAPPMSAQPSVDALRPRASKDDGYRPQALISEDTDVRDRQIKQLRVLTGVAIALAAIALIIAFSSGGGQGTVDGSHIADNAVTSPKIANGAVTAAKLAPGTVTQGKPGQTGATGPRGPIGHVGSRGPVGAPGITGVQTVTKHAATGPERTQTLTVPCPAGKSLIYGGATLTGETAGVALQSSGPAVDGSAAWTANASFFPTTTTVTDPKGKPQATTATPGDWGLTVTASCANFAKPKSPKKATHRSGNIKPGRGASVGPLPNTTVPPSAQIKH